MHVQPAKRSFSAIFKSKPKKQGIRYKYKDQVSAKIMLEQKADLQNHVRAKADLLSKYKKCAASASVVCCDSL